MANSRGSRRCAVKAQNDDHDNGTGWHPPALRWRILTLAAVICWIIIAALRYLLKRSQSEGGIIFDPDINNIPLRRSFVYLYLPTIIAVFFSIFILWIDHDAKRFEPYRQMSRSSGALGQDSMLLEYPFDFAPFVPFVAAKRGHWLVFWSSLASTLVNFGVVPLQAAIFTTQSVRQYSNVGFSISDWHMPSRDQEASLTLGFAQSSYGILELNETLPAYMMQNYTLRPFTANNVHSGNGTWKANTTMYSLSLQCEQGYEAFDDDDNAMPHQAESGFRSSFGCFIREDIKNKAVAGEAVVTSRSIKAFSAKFMARYREHDKIWGNAYNPFPNLKYYCSNESIGTFYASFTKNRLSKADPPTDIMAMYCRTAYHEQDVEATIDMNTKEPISIVENGIKRTMSSDLFNKTVFEETLASGQRQIIVRQNGLPGSTIPRYTQQVINLDLTDAIYLHPMAAMAIVTSKDNISHLVNFQALETAYLRVYQLLFARAMTEVLRTNFSSSTLTSDIIGQQVENVGAIVLEPVFVHSVECLLALVSIAALTILYLGYSPRTRCKLSDEPSPITTVMSIVADETNILAKFSAVGASSKSLRQAIQRTRYHLNKVNDLNAFVDSESDEFVRGDGKITMIVSPDEQQQDLLTQRELDDQPQIGPSSLTRPLVFRLFTGIPIINLFIALTVALAVLFKRAQPLGLQLPSRNRFVQNLLADYLPTAIATLIEPVWILLNRLLCNLQPFEELQKLDRPANRSITWNYGSLPPQLTICKALRNRHFMLAILCTMVLLANVLATTFAGLFVQDFVPISRMTEFLPPYIGKFSQMTDSIFGSEDNTPFADTSYSVLTGLSGDHFLLAESNYTRNTSLPSWTDEHAAYTPFKVFGGPDLGHTYRARTRYFRVQPNCRPRQFNEDFEIRLHGYVNENNQTQDRTLKVNTIEADGQRMTCHTPSMFLFGLGLPRGRITWEQACRTGKLAAEFATALNVHEDNTQRANHTCRSVAVAAWLRASLYNCTEGSTEPMPEANEDNILLVSCQPRIQTGIALVHVDAAGVLQEPASDLLPDSGLDNAALEKYFVGDAEDLVRQSLPFIMRTARSIWHNDTFASEYISYFVNRAVGHQRLTDPFEPLPTFEEVVEPLNKAYARLFAIWLGINLESLLEPATNETAPIKGEYIALEERILLVKPLFIISEVILGIYILVSIILYIKRPGRYLVRQPTSIAAIIALFAPSSAVKDLRGTSHMSNKEREQFLADLDFRYGYGTYIGTDGCVHLGIEKAPFVKHFSEATLNKTESEIELQNAIVTEGGKKRVATVRYMPLREEDGEARAEPSALDDESRGTDEEIQPPPAFPDSPLTQHTAYEESSTETSFNDEFRGSIEEIQSARMMQNSTMVEHTNDEGEGVKAFLDEESRDPVQEIQCVSAIQNNTMAQHANDRAN